MNRIQKAIYRFLDRLRRPSPIQKQRLQLFYGEDAALTYSEDVLMDYISSGRSCAVLDLSDLEVDVLLEMTKKTIARKRLKKLAERMKEQTLFYPTDEETLVFYAKLLKETYCESDILLTHGENRKERRLFHRLKSRQELAKAEVMRLNFQNWSESLRGKRVMLISENPQLHQQAFHDLDVQIMLFPLSPKEAKMYDSWFEWLDAMKMQIMGKEFDVALVDFDCMTNPICYFLSTVNKIALAIHEETFYEEKLD